MIRACLQGVVHCIHWLYLLYRWIERFWFRNVKKPTASIRNQHAVVTGASVVDGIGFEIAARLLAEGASKVLITSRRAHDLERSAKALVERTGVDPSTVVWFAADLAKQDEVESLAKNAVSMMDGVVDIVVNNAATEITGNATDIDASIIENVVSSNLIAPQTLTRHLLPAMLKRGRGTFVYFSSILGLVPAPHCATYTSTKTGMRAYVHSMRYEFMDSPVQFTCVSPTHVKGPHGQGARLECASQQQSPDYYGSVSATTVAKNVVHSIRYNRAEVDCNKYIWTKLFWILHELGCMETMDQLMNGDNNGRAYLKRASDSKRILTIHSNEERCAISKQWKTKFN